MATGRVRCGGWLRTRDGSSGAGGGLNGTGLRVPEAPRHSRGRFAARGPVPLASDKKVEARRVGERSRSVWPILAQRRDFCRLPSRTSRARSAAPLAPGLWPSIAAGPLIEPAPPQADSIRGPDVCALQLGQERHHHRSPLPELPGRVGLGPMTRPTPPQVERVTGPKPRRRLRPRASRRPVQPCGDGDGCRCSQGHR